MPLRTVPPSPDDLRRARDARESPLSPLLLLAVGAVTLRALAPWLFASLRSSVRASLGSLTAGPPRVVDALSRGLSPLLIALALVAASAALASLAQTRAALHRGSRPRRAAPEGVGALGAAVLTGAALALAAHVASTPPGEPALDRARAAADALIALAVAVGVGDYALRYARWRASLHLTPEQARRRTREREGDPLLRARRRALHRAWSAPEATPSDWRLLSDGERLVVVSWREGEAPRVVLHAAGALHHEALARAAELAVPRFHHPALVRALGAVPAGGELPGPQREVLAALLAADAAARTDGAARVDSAGA